MYAPRLPAPQQSRSAIPTPTSTLLTVREAATYLRVCTKTVRTLVKSGTLPHSRVGKQIRITQESVNSYLGLGKPLMAAIGHKLPVIPRISK